MPNRKTVLIVDNDKDVRGVLREYLSVNGFAVECCDSSDKALELSSEKCFDVIITDCHMPTMQDAAITKTIRDQCPHGLHIGMNARLVSPGPVYADGIVFLQKPIMPATLMSILKDR